MILCAGESLVDLVPAPGGGCEARPGGAVFNTALGLGRLGARAGYLWPLSTDAHGRRLRGLLEDASLDTGACPVTDLPTATAEVTLSGGEASYRFTLAGTTASALGPQPLPQGCRALFIGGISLAIEPSATAIQSLTRDAAAAGLPVMLDPNIRPACIADPARHRERLMRLIRAAAIVKLSRDDLDWLWPGRDPGEAAAELLGLGPVLVLVTFGAEGAAAFRRGGTIHRPAPRVAVADTIGAGDSFNAGLLAGLDRRGALGREAVAALDDAALTGVLDFAVRVASLTVSRPDAGPPWRDDV